MGLFNPGSGTGGPRAKAQRLEMLGGIIGFFALMALIQAVVKEVRGENAVGAALLLAVLVGALYVVIRKRMSLDL